MWHGHGKFPLCLKRKKPRGKTSLRDMSLANAWSTNCDKQETYKNGQYLCYKKIHQQFDTRSVYY